MLQVRTVSLLLKHFFFIIHFSKESEKMLKNYKKLSVIGAGSFGKAWLVTHAENTRKMVCKVCVW